MFLLGSKRKEGLMSYIRKRGSLKSCKVLHVTGWRDLGKNKLAKSIKLTCLENEGLTSISLVVFTDACMIWIASSSGRIDCKRSQHADR